MGIGVRFGEGIKGFGGKGRAFLGEEKSRPTKGKNRKMTYSSFCHVSFDFDLLLRFAFAGLALGGWWPVMDHGWVVGWQGKGVGGHDAGGWGEGCGWVVVRDGQI
ncbi:hypothetical protein RJT34_15843 [Clitoria ternatea]|uniref:Uncharacterized protein n=1 Tax=Clitoria ternatea TaxID=43366 RepID=A0AAN9PBT8_CLITE